MGTGIGRVSLESDHVQEFLSFYGAGAYNVPRVVDDQRRVSMLSDTPARRPVPEKKKGRDKKIKNRRRMQRQSKRRNRKG